MWENGMSWFSHWFNSTKMPEASEASEASEVTEVTSLSLPWVDLLKDGIVGLVSAMMFTAVVVSIYFLVNYARFLFSHEGLVCMPWMSQRDRRLDVINGAAQSRGSGSVLCPKDNGAKSQTRSVNGQVINETVNGAKTIRQKQLIFLAETNTHSESDNFHSAHNVSSSACAESHNDGAAVKSQPARVKKRRQLDYVVDGVAGKRVKGACRTLEQNESSSLQMAMDSDRSGTSSESMACHDKCLNAEEATMALLHGDFGAGIPVREAYGQEMDNDIESQDVPDKVSVLVKRKRGKARKDARTKKPLDLNPEPVNTSYLIPRVVRSHINLTGDLLVTPDQLLVSDTTPTYRPLSISVRKRHGPPTNVRLSNALSKLGRKRSHGPEVAGAHDDGCPCRDQDNATASKLTQKVVLDSRRKRFRGKPGVGGNVDLTNSRPNDPSEQRARKIANSNMLLRDTFAPPCDIANGKVKSRDFKSQKPLLIQGDKWEFGDNVSGPFHPQHMVRDSLRQRASPKTRKAETLVHGHPNKRYRNDQAKPNWSDVQHGPSQRKVLYVKKCGSPQQRAPSRLKKKKIKCNACTISQILHRDQGFRNEARIASANCSSNMNPVPSDISLIDNSHREGEHVRRGGGVCWFPERKKRALAQSKCPPTISENWCQGYEGLLPGEADYAGDSLGEHQQPLSPTRWNVSPMNSSSYDSSVLTMRSFVSYRLHQLFDKGGGGLVAAAGMPLYENEEDDRPMSRRREEKIYYFHYDSDNGSCNVDLSASSGEKLQDDDFLSTQVHVGNSVIHPTPPASIPSERVNRPDSMSLAFLNAHRCPGPTGNRVEDIVTPDHPDVMHYRWGSPRGAPNDTHTQPKNKQAKTEYKRSRIPVPSYKTPNSVQARVQCDRKPPPKPSNKIQKNIQKSFQSQTLTTRPQRTTRAGVRPRFDQPAVNVDRDKRSQDWNLGSTQVMGQVPCKRPMFNHSNRARVNMFGNSSQGERLGNTKEYTLEKNPKAQEPNAFGAKVNAADENAKIGVKNINKVLNDTEIDKEKGKTYTECRKSFVKENARQANVKEPSGNSRMFKTSEGKRLATQNQYGHQLSAGIPGDVNSFKEQLLKKLSDASENGAKIENECPKPRADYGNMNRTQVQRIVNQEASYSCGDHDALARQLKVGETRARSLVGAGKRRALKNDDKSIEVEHYLQGTGDLGQKILNCQISETRGVITGQSTSSACSRNDEEIDGKRKNSRNYENVVPSSNLLPNMTPLTGDSPINKLSATSALTTLQPSTYRSDAFPITCITYRDYYSMSDRTSHTTTPVTSGQKWIPQYNKSFPQSKSNTSVSEAPKQAYARAPSLSGQDAACRNAAPQKARDRPLHGRLVHRKDSNAFSDTSSLPQKTPFLHRRTEGASPRGQKHPLQGQTPPTPEKPVLISDSNSKLIPIAKPEEVPAILDGLKETLMLRRKSFISKSASKELSKAKKKEAFKDKPDSRTDSSPDTYKGNTKALKRPRSRISNSASSSPVKPSFSRKSSPFNCKKSANEKGRTKSPPRVKERKLQENVTPIRIAKDVRATETKKRLNTAVRKNANKFLKQTGAREGLKQKRPYDRNLKQSMNVGKAEKKRAVGSSGSLKKSTPEQTPTARHLLGDVDALREKYLREMVSKDIYKHLPVDISPTGYRKSVLEHYQWMTSNYPGAFSNTGSRYSDNKHSVRQGRQSYILPGNAALTRGNAQGRSLVAPSYGGKKGSQSLDRPDSNSYSQCVNKQFQETMASLPPNASGLTIRAFEEDIRISRLKENLTHVAVNANCVDQQEEIQPGPLGLQASECGFKELHLENSTERCQLANDVLSSISADSQKEEKPPNENLAADEDFQADAYHSEHNQVLDNTLEAFVGDICNEAQYYISKREYFKFKTDTRHEKELARNSEGIRVVNAESAGNRKASKESIKSTEAFKRDDFPLSNSGSRVQETRTKSASRNKTASGNDLLLNKVPLLAKSSAKPCVNSKYYGPVQAIENIKRSRSDAAKEASNAETMSYPRGLESNIHQVTEAYPCGAQVKATNASAEISLVTPYPQTNYEHMTQLLENSQSRKSSSRLHPEDVSTLQNGGSGVKLCDEKKQFQHELEKQRRNLRRLGLRRSINQKYVTSALQHNRKKTVSATSYERHSVLEKNNSANFRRCALKSIQDKCITDNSKSCSGCPVEFVSPAHCAGFMDLNTDRIHKGIAFNEEQADASAWGRANNDQSTFGVGENALTAQGAVQAGLVRMRDAREGFPRSPGARYDPVERRSSENKTGDFGQANMSACAQVSFDWYRPSASANVQRETTSGHEQEDARELRSRDINETTHSRFHQMCANKVACASENLSGCCHYLQNGVVHNAKTGSAGMDNFRLETRNTEAHICPYSRGIRNKVLAQRPHIVMLPCLPNVVQDEDPGSFPRGDRCSRSADSQTVNTGSCSKLKSARTCCQRLRQPRDPNRLADGLDNKSNMLSLYRNLLCTYNQANQEFHDNWLIQNNSYALCRHNNTGGHCPCDSCLGENEGNGMFPESPPQLGGESDLDL